MGQHEILACGFLNHIFIGTDLVRTEIFLDLSILKKEKKL